MWEKKDKHCDPSNRADRDLGSWWDHILFDPDSKLIVTLVIGRRTLDTARQAFADFYVRTDGQLPPVIASDEYPAYFTVIVSTYGVRKEALELTDAEKIEFDYEEMPSIHIPVEIAYVTVQKQREKGRVVKVEKRIILGTEKQVTEALEQGSSSPTINTNYVERWNGTQRHFNARKARKVYTFSKERPFHEAVTWLVVVWYNFVWCPQPLRQKIQIDPPRYLYRTPAMAAGLVQEGWSLERIFGYPVYQHKRS